MIALLISFDIRVISSFRTMGVFSPLEVEIINRTIGVSCRNLYFCLVYLYVNGSGSITSVGVERANVSAVVYL